MHVCRIAGVVILASIAAATAQNISRGFPEGLVPDQKTAIAIAEAVLFDSAILSAVAELVLVRCMRAVSITMIIIALWIEAPRASADAIDFGKMSKAQLVHQLGLPAEIMLLRGPEPEIWRYYYTHDDGVVLLFSIGLREGRVVT